ncbi:MAG: SAM-dependent methyltransferase [Anaerolineae bacterium]
MSVFYDSVKPWGRLLSEYVAMFALRDADRQRHILGCSDGPASFNAEMTALGHRVISVDPLYTLSASQIEARVQATWRDIIAQVEANQAMFIWDHFGTPQALGEARLRAMRHFLDDYDAGKRAGRYLPAQLPALPFADAQFELALCGNFLFLYDSHFSLDFHLDAVRELCRVAQEVRIFPIHGLQNTLAEQVRPVEEALRAEDWQVERVTVPYQFRQGSNQMLRLWRTA